jgi:hypothetical protein
MENAAAQLRRVLHLIPLLADDEDHPIEEVARLAGVDRRTIVKDLRSLADRFDDPGGFVQGVQILIEPDCVSVHTSHFQRPMRLTRQELAALELGLAMIRGERPPEEHRAIDRARERLGEAVAELPDDAAPALAERIGAPLVAAGEDPAHRSLVRTAIEDQRKRGRRHRGRSVPRASYTRAGCGTSSPTATTAGSGSSGWIACCEWRFSTSPSSAATNGPWKRSSRARCSARNRPARCGSGIRARSRAGSRSGWDASRTPTEG